MVGAKTLRAMFVVRGRLREICDFDAVRAGPSARHARCL